MNFLSTLLFLLLALTALVSADKQIKKRISMSNMVKEQATVVFSADDLVKVTKYEWMNLDYGHSSPDGKGHVCSSLRERYQLAMISDRYEQDTIANVKVVCQYGGENGISCIAVNLDFSGLYFNAMYIVCEKFFPNDVDGIVENSCALHFALSPTTVSPFCYSGVGEFKCERFIERRNELVYLPIYA